MYYLLFLVYLLLLCGIVARSGFIRRAALGNRLTLLLFFCWVSAGLINSYLDLHYYTVSDARTFNQMGIDEFHLLLQQPRTYLSDIFQSNHHNSYGGFLEDTHSFWNDTRSNLIVKLLSVFDLFSRGNLYINALFYNFLVFFGCIASYRTWARFFPGRKGILVVGIFLLPSTLFYGSCLLRDGLIYLALGCSLFHLAALADVPRKRFRHIACAIPFLLLILLLRNFVFIALVPALLGWWLASRRPRHALRTFLAVYAGCAVLFFTTGWLPYGYNLPAHVSNRQSDFIVIARNGASAVAVRPLTPDVRGFLENLPQAISLSLMRPFITERRTPLYIPAALELLAYQLLLVLFVVFHRKDRQVPPWVYCSVFFAMTMFLMIGYTIPILGAIERYRSIYFPCVLVPAACFTDWKRVGALLHIR